MWGSCSSGSDAPSKIDIDVADDGGVKNHTVRVDSGDPSTALTSTPCNRVARAGIDVVCYHYATYRYETKKYEKSEKITKLGRKAPRNSTPAADANNSVACGAVARRRRGCGWVTAIDAYCI
ncbi:hypothetical protein Y032_0013g2024 [Ancylostoma ceylanicum]|uniref:Uncharacterized protein n=1 Tax=Ancylostoma ceylanicum TaxID=53326 RepID=A0A016VBL0_9BILA|nr:hypothetical protein Y032_0013g2024 [Ancylostoma ceylanicum]